jgi:hypothetical protein
MTTTTYRRASNPDCLRALEILKPSYDLNGQREAPQYVADRRTSTLPVSVPLRSTSDALSLEPTMLQHPTDQFPGWRWSPAPSCARFLHLIRWRPERRSSVAFGTLP